MPDDTNPVMGPRYLGAGIEWGAKWSDGGHCPATPARSEEFARRHAHTFGTRPIRRDVGPWVYDDTGEPVTDDGEDTRRA
jgi:hypothetical protein